jgi:hypothetical protein
VQEFLEDHEGAELSLDVIRNGIFNVEGYDLFEDLERRLMKQIVDSTNVCFVSKHLCLRVTYQICCEMNDFFVKLGNPN